jgi:hypothetical protein
LGKKIKRNKQIKNKKKQTNLREEGTRSRVRKFVSGLYIQRSTKPTTHTQQETPSMDLDIQDQLCPFLYANMLIPNFRKGLTVLETDREAHIIASIRTAPLLSMFALVSRTFHLELQKHRRQKLSVLVQQLIDDTPDRSRRSRQRPVENYIVGTQPLVQTGHHQGGGKPSRCKDPGDEVVEGGWVPRSVGSWREGLREGRRRKKVTRWVGTKRESVVGTR